MFWSCLVSSLVSLLEKMGSKNSKCESEENADNKNLMKLDSISTVSMAFTANDGTDDIDAKAVVCSCQSQRQRQHQLISNQSGILRLIMIDGHEPQRIA